MSHTGSSTQNMAFTNNVGVMDNAQAREDIGFADTLCQSRSFTSTGSNFAEQNGLNGSLSTVFGGRGNAWGSSSIWSGGLTSGMSSGNGAHDRSRARESTQHSTAPSTKDDVEGKTGSGSLVDSSVSEDYRGRASWASSHRNSASGLSVQQTRYGDSSVSQQRHASTAGLSQFSGTNQNGIAGASRPPAINLNSTPSVQTRQSFGSAFTSGLAGKTSELPPFNVYTKFDRPSEPVQRKPDSAVGGWVETATTPSPTDERRPAFPNPIGRTASVSTSRDSSVPTSRHSDEPPLFTRPEYFRPSQRATPNSSRAPSMSSVRNGMHNGYNSGNTDLMTAQFGQLGLNGDSRPSTSHRQVMGNGTYSPNGTPPTGRSNTHKHASSFHRPGTAENPPRTRPDGASYYASGRIQPAPYQNSRTASSGPSFAERYFQSGNNYEFQPGQPYTGNGVNMRPYDLHTDTHTAEWHDHMVGALALNRRSPSVSEQQAYLDPRVQQLMAAQLRNPFSPIYSPYALPGCLPFGAPSPYPGLMAHGMPGVESSTGQHDSPVGDGVQSALMYEFKSNTKTKRYELRDIYDHIAEFSGDQHGSRFIQTKLETANSDEKQRVFQEIEPNAIPLMTDVFGNYVIQKFFEHGDQTHKKILANKMRGQVLQLSLQMYGCRVVQKALDHVLVDQQAQLIGELRNYVLKCVKDQNGNHVIQKAIEKCPSSTIDFIIAAFHGQVQHLSIHPYGCRVIQRCLEKYDLPSRGMILSELMDGIQSMISDQFGNYVVQHIVCHDEGEPKRRVLAIVAHSLEGYSKHKFASNVVEKCLERSDDTWRRQVVFNLEAANRRLPSGEGVLVGLIKDSFGNYVVQKLLDTLSPDDYFQFLEVLQPAMAQAKRTGCGKQVLSIDKKMHRFDSFHNTNNDHALNSFATNSIDGLPPFHPHAGFQHQLPTPPFTTNYNSAATTPPPLTAGSQSLQSSGIPSVNGDAVEGATISSRKGGEQVAAAENGFPPLR